MKGGRLFSTTLWRKLFSIPFVTIVTPLTLLFTGSSFLVGGEEARRQGTAHASIVPYQRFPTRDGYIVTGAGNDLQFGRFCKVRFVGFERVIFTSTLYN